MSGDEGALRETADAGILDATTAGGLAVRGGALRLGGFVGGSLAGLGAAALLYRHLGVRVVGQYGLILALVGIVAAYSDLGLTAVGIRLASTLGAEERGVMLRDLLGLRLALSVVGILGVTLVCVVVYPSVIALGVIIAGAGLLLQVGLDNYQISLVVNLRLGWVAAINFGVNLAAAMLTVALVLAGARLLDFVAIAIPVGVGALATAGRQVRDKRGLAPTYDRQRWRAMLARSVAYSVAVAVAGLYFNAAIVLTSLLANGQQLGYLQLSFRVVVVLGVVPALLSGSALPIFARAARDDIERLGYSLGRVFEVSLLAGAWVAVSLAVGARFVVEVVGGSTPGHNFLPAAPVLAFQGVAVGGTFVISVASYGLLSLGLNKQILALAISGLLVLVTLLVVLIPLDGARGAAIGTMISEVSFAVISWVVLVAARRELRPPLRILPGVALAALAGCGPMLLTSWPVIGRVLLSTALYASVVLVTRAYPAELLDLLPNRLRRSRLAR